MRLFATVITGLTLFAAVSATAAPRPDAETRLAKAIEGRVAGPPVDCIQQRQIRSSQIIEGTAIIYEVGRTIYVNRPTSGASSLHRDDILVTDTHSSQLCSIDIVKLFDNSTRFPDGFVGLGQFVPYTKPAAPR